MKVHYVPGVDNVPADVLSRYNQHVENESGQPAGRHSLADVSVARAVRTWLSVVASHVDFDECVAAAVEGLSRGLPLASFGCTKCGASHMDLGQYARKLHTRHVCTQCGHKWSRTPPVLGNPLAAFGCYLKGATLFVAQVPVSAEALQKVPAHVGCVHQSSGGTRVEGSCSAAPLLCGPGVIGQSRGQCCCGTCGGPRGPCVGTVLLLEVEPTFLVRVSDATWQHADVEMRKLA